MDIRFEDDGRCRRLRLSGELTIYQAEAAKRALLDALAANAALELDLSAVGEIDSTGIQLLLLLQREARAAGRTLAFGAQSEAVRELVALFELGEAVGEGRVVAEEPRP